MMTIVRMIPYMKVRTIPQISIDFAFLGSLALVTAQAINPPSHVKNMGNSHHQPLTDWITGADGVTTASDFAMNNLFAHGWQYTLSCSSVLHARHTIFPQFTQAPTASLPG